MTQPIRIKSTEHGVLRVFLMSEQLATELRSAGTLDSLKQALGTDRLATEDVQVVQLNTIKEMGLTEFLIEAYDIDPAEIDPAKNRLDALEGDAALIRSAAFGGQETVLKPSEDVTLIGTYHEQNAPPPSFSELNELRSDSAKGVVGSAGTPEPQPRTRAQTWMLAITIAFVLAVILFIIRLFFGS